MKTYILTEPEAGTLCGGCCFLVKNDCKLSYNVSLERKLNKTIGNCVKLKKIYKENGNSTIQSL